MKRTWQLISRRTDYHVKAVMADSAYPIPTMRLVSADFPGHLVHQVPFGSRVAIQQK
jgi:hypothetical protein